MASKNCKGVTRITVSINDNVLAELDRKAEEMGCGRSMYIAMALKQRWQQEDSMKNMPMMYTTLAKAVQLIDEVKSDPAMLEKLRSDPLLLEDLANFPD